MSKIDRREFLQSTAMALGGLMAAGPVAAQNRATGLTELSISQIADLFSRRRLTPKAATKWYLDRIAALDKDINSIIEINPDAMSISASRERDGQNTRGLLWGIPVVLKDNIDTADKMKSTAGSLALLDAPTPAHDAFIVKKLREAGAIIVGKTNLSEWANFRDTESISGWSGRGGQTRNPYILDRNPCGSSSGTGAAIAANFSAVGVGTETDGSIVCPSSICGIVGIKPTIGLVSRSGIIPIAASQDTAGPMTRTVADAATLLTVLAGADPNDAATLHKRPGVDYREFLKDDGLKGARIGVARDYWDRRADVDAVTSKTLEDMKRAGATLVDVRFPHLQKLNGPEFLVLQYEFKDGLERYLRERNSKYKTLNDLIKFNNDNAAREMPYFKQSIFEMSAKCGDLNSKEYLEALETCRKYSREEGIDEVMNKHQLDAIVAPSNAPTWMIDTVNGDCGSGYIGSSSLAAVAGYPNITVPAGSIKELPIGISFFGRAWSEGLLIKLAHSFERMTNARKMPRYLTTYK